MLRLACFWAFSTAGGTSFALPYPQPTLPLPSPTTTSAAKLKRRPPLTTAAQRLICTVLSMYSLRDSVDTVHSAQKDPDSLVLKNSIPLPARSQRALLRGRDTCSDLDRARLP